MVVSAELVYFLLTVPRHGRTVKRFALESLARMYLRCRQCTGEYNDAGTVGPL
jgi:hypothetical protein